MNWVCLRSLPSLGSATCRGRIWPALGVEVGSPLLREGPRSPSYAKDWTCQLASLMGETLASPFGQRDTAAYSHSSVRNVADTVTSICLLHVSVSQLVLNLSQKRKVLCMDPTKSQHQMLDRVSVEFNEMP